MNELKVFENVQLGKVRTLEIKGEPYFVGKDVAEILGYERATKAIQDHVDIEDKDEVPIQDSIGRMQKTPIINESGMYSLILSSKLPKAKEFKRWVTSEVLPTIRKTGGYVSNATQMVDTYFSSMDGMHKELVKGLLMNIEAQKKQLAEAQPKVQYHDEVLDTSSYMTLTEIAKAEGFPSACQVNKLLEEHKVIYRVGYRGSSSRKQPSEYPHAFTAAYGYLLLEGYAKIATLVMGGSTKNRTKHTIKWSEKGRKWLHEFLTQN